MNKRNREHAILQMVYDEDAFQSVQQQETPDFVLRHRGAESFFGVEITELYETESDARVMNHPAYVSELLAGGTHMHRDDLTTLDVASVAIRGPDGQLKHSNVPAIIRQLPSHEKHAEALARAIRRKSEMVSTYAPQLSHVNLVVLDRFDVPFGTHPDYAVDELFTPELRAAVLDTGFREVLFVSTTPDRKRTYRPLRMLLLLESFYLFLRALTSFGLQGTPLGPLDLAPLFVRAIEGTGMGVSLVGETEEYQYAFYGGAGIRHTGDQISILDFHDRVTPPALELPANPYSAEAWERFRDHHMACVSSNSFVCQVAIPVLLDA